MSRKASRCGRPTARARRRGAAAPVRRGPAVWSRLPQERQEMRRLTYFIVVVVAHQGTGNMVVGQQLAGMPRIFGGNQINTLQDAQGAQGNIFKIANGRCQHVQRPPLGSAGSRATPLFHAVFLLPAACDRLPAFQRYSRPWADEWPAAATR